MRYKGDAHTPGSDVLASLAEKNSLLLQLLKECRPAWSKIREEKISGARVCLHTELFQFCREPRAQSFNTIHVTLHRCPIGYGGFPWHPSGAVDGGGRP